MYLWLAASFLGLLAGVITPAAWFLVDKFQVALSQQDWSPLTMAFLLPALVALFLFFLFRAGRFYRSSDSFTAFFSDFHYSGGRRNPLFCFIHGVGSFFFLLGGGIVGLEALCFEWVTALGSYLGERAKLTPMRVQLLSLCGLAAGFSATLGQPAAAILFTVELLFGWGGWTMAIAPLALCAFIASVVSQALTAPTGIFHSTMGTDAGLSLLFQEMPLSMGSWEILSSSVLIIFFATALAVLTIWLFYKTNFQIHTLFQTRRSSDISYKAFAFQLLVWTLFTGAAAYKFPEILGSSLMNASTWQSFPLYGIALILLVRLLLSTMSYTVLGSMGMLLPILILGSFLGFGLATFQSHFFAENMGVVLLTLGAFFAATFGTPVAATALVYGYAEISMSENTNFFFMSIIVNFAAHFLCGLIHKDRLMTIGLYRHGIRFRNGMCFNTLSSITVKSTTLSHVDPIPHDSSMSNAYATLMKSRFLKIPVIDNEKKFIGMISLSDFFALRNWKNIDKSSQIYDLLGITNLMRTNFPTVTTNMSLEEALVIMGDEELVPVVSEKNTLEGLLLKSELMGLYNKEVMKKAFGR